MAALRIVSDEVQCPCGTNSMRSYLFRISQKSEIVVCTRNKSCSFTFAVVLVTSGLFALADLFRFVDVVVVSSLCIVAGVPLGCGEDWEGDIVPAGRW